MLTILPFWCLVITLVLLNILLVWNLKNLICGLLIISCLCIWVKLNQFYLDLQELKQHPNLKVQCNGTNVNSTSCVKYLGAKLDSNLSGESMSQDVLKKVNTRLKFLYRKGNCLDLSSRRLLANSLILCVFDYACCSWFSGLSIKTQNMLQVYQNKVLRFALDLHPRTSLNSSHFFSMNWLPLKLTFLN